MKSTAPVVFASLISGGVAVDGGSPIAKVIAMIDELYTKVVAEGRTGQNEYDEFREWCEERSANVGFEIKTGQAQVEELRANIANFDAKATSLGSKIEELGASIAAEKADLKDAQAIRAAEKTDFESAEAELEETIDMLTRAVQVLSKQGISMTQIKQAGGLAKILATLTDASALNYKDSKKLLALVQDAHRDDDDTLDAPAATVYESHSSDIVSTINDLREKAESQLDEVRQKETNAAHKFEMLAQSLTDSLKVTAADAAEAKKTLAQNAESKSVATGDLEITSKDLAEDTEVLATLHQKCKAKAEAFEAAVKGRGEELAALSKAKTIIVEATSPTPAFLQLSMSPQLTAARFVRDLARREKSVGLAQLAAEIGSIRSGDIFAKVKKLIGDMIAKLESEAGDDATEKEFCDKQIAETKAKRDKKESTIDKLNTKIDQAIARSSQLKEEIAALSKQLADLAASGAAMTKMREEEKTAFAANEAETSKGLEGIKLALATLRDYYSTGAGDHGKSEGSAGGIVSLLEVCESDFTKNLAEMRSAEEAAIAAYEEQTKQNALTKQVKEKDVEYKTKESVQLDKISSELRSDRDGVKIELDAVIEYQSKINDRCIAKAESYADRSAARQAEIAGLREALQILGAPSLSQTRRFLRTVAAHHS